MRFRTRTHQVTCKPQTRRATETMGIPRGFSSETGWDAAVCVDYRKLDAITVRDTYPIPRMGTLSAPERFL